MPILNNIGGSNIFPNNGNNLGIAPRGGDNLQGVYDETTNSINITWSDRVCDFFGGTRVVVKADSMPSSYEDGDYVFDNKIIDAFKETPLSIPLDNITTNDNKFYVVLFPFSTTWVMNTVMVDVLEFRLSKLFANCTWSEIATISENGLASERFNIGDIKPLTLSDGNTYNMRIFGFNKFQLSDGSGNAGILLVSDELYTKQFKDLTSSDISEEYRILYGEITKYQSWIPKYSSYLKNLIMNSDNELTNLIKTVSNPIMLDETNNISVDTNFVFLPSSLLESIDQNNRIRKINGTTTPGLYPINYGDKSNGIYMRCVKENGEISTGDYKLFTFSGSAAGAVYPLIAFNI